MLGSEGEEAATEVRRIEAQFSYAICSAWFGQSSPALRGALRLTPCKPAGRAGEEAEQANRAAPIGVIASEHSGKLNGTQVKFVTGLRMRIDSKKRRY